MTVEVITVLIVDDHTVVRRGIQAFLALVPDITVVGEAEDGESGLRALRQLADAGTLPDVVLMDLMMPRMGGIAATAEIHRHYPGVRVVAMTSFSEAERVHAVLQAGAAGYLLKDAEAEEVAAAIRAAHRGEVHLDAAVTRKLSRTLVAGGTTAASLTQREREVLVLVAKGESNQDIADALQISERTARAHVSNVLTKLSLTSRTQAAVWAIAEGLVPAPEPNLSHSGASVQSALRPSFLDRA